jgi:uroporphyrinogen-III synthase
VAERPLAGRRVAVTRPEAQARELAEKLERLGATVLVRPLVRIEPVDDTTALEDALARIESYDWVVLTSANGVAAIASHVRSLAGARVATVGPATADAVRGLGTEPAFVPERFAAEEVAEGLAPLEGARVLLPQADLAEPGLADELRGRGAHVDAITAYRTVGVRLSAAELAEVRAVGAVVLASGSAARSLAAQGGAGDALVACIGPKTADVARSVGLEVGLVARDATSEGIIEALVRHFGEQS